MADGDRKFWLGAMLLFGSYAASLLVVDPRGDFPLNDDWVYARDCIESSSAGRLVLTKYESAWSLPQIILGSVATRAFGFSHAAFRICGIASLLASGLLIDVYLRRSGLPPGGRLVAPGSWIFNPVGYVLSLTFMTDLPFLVVWIAACYCWDEALASGRGRWIALAVALTLVATAQRQFALFIPVAAGALILARLLHGLRRGSSEAGALTRSASTVVASLAAAGVCVAFFVALSRWMAGGGAYQAPIVVLRRSPAQYILAIIRTAGFFALMSSPLLLVLAGPPPGRRRGRVALALMAAAAASAAAFLASGKPVPFGNLLSEFGLFPEDQLLLGTREVIFGAGWNSGVTLITLLGALAMIRLACGLHWDQLREPLWDSPGGPEAGGVRPGGFGGVLMVAGAMMLPIFLLRGVFFDRYLLPTLPAIWVALAKCRMADSRARLAAAAALIAASAALSIALASDYFRWNEARWAAAGKLHRGGVAANRINAGYEWFGMMVGDTDHPSMNPKNFDYVVSFSGPTPGFREVDVAPYRSIFPPHDRTLHVLENEASRGR